MFFLILMLIVTGLCWLIEGIVVSQCAQHGLCYRKVQGIFAAGNALIAFCTMLCSGAWPQIGTRETCLVAMLFALAGCANFFAFHFTNVAMKYGHNGIVWSLMQSGMVLSFLMGAIFFHDKATALRVIGLIMILAGMFLLGCAKSSGIGDKKYPLSKWLFPTFAAFLLVGLTHCFIVLPSYYNALATSSFFRGTWLAGASFLCFLGSSFFSKNTQKSNGKIEWMFALLLIAIGFISSYVILYPTIDRLAQRHLGGIAYPVSIGVCIVAFMLYSTLVTKEKSSPAGWLGVLLASLGIACITVQ